MNLVIIQSRNGSSRLPFKSSLSLVGYPTIIHVVNRVKKILGDNASIIVATSSNIEDDVISDICELSKIKCFRGHPTNVLSRFQEIYKIYQPENIIRITGDCPLIDANIINNLIDILEKNKEIDYVSNTIDRSFPHGFDTEIFRAFLINKNRNFSKADFEHVTPFLYSSKEFKVKQYINNVDYSKYRVTLDTKYDYFFINKLLKKKIQKSGINSNFDIINSEEISNLIENDKELLELQFLALNKSKE